MVVAVICIDAYPFLAFSDLTCHLKATGIGVFWYGNRCFLVTQCCLIVRRPNLEVARKRLLYQQVKIPE